MAYKAAVQLRENIKTLLRIHKVDQKDVAAAMGRDPSTLNKFLQGTREVQLKDLDAIADFFSVATYELFQPGGSTLTERRSGTERRTGHDRRVGHAHRMMKSVAAEVVRIWRKGPALKHGETPPAVDADDILKALVEEFEQRATPLLAAAEASARRQASGDRRKVPAAPPAIRPVSRSRAPKA